MHLTTKTGGLSNGIRYSADLGENMFGVSSSRQRVAVEIHSCPIRQEMRLYIFSGRSRNWALGPSCRAKVVERGKKGGVDWSAGMVFVE